jgi:hypothetical protein
MDRPVEKSMSRKVLVVGAGASGQDQARRSTSRAPGEFPPAGEVRESLVQTVEGTADRLDILGCLEVEDEEHLV